MIYLIEHRIYDFKEGDSREKTVNEFIEDLVDKVNELIEEVNKIRMELGK